MTTLFAKLLFALNGIVCSTEGFTSTYVSMTATYCEPFHHVICAVGVYNDEGASVCCGQDGQCHVLPECLAVQQHVCDVQDA
jgi:hypothetical protein